jgi:restriction system protein
MGTRRTDDGLFDSLFEIARVLPWWLDLGIAAGAGAGLHHVAKSPPPTGPSTLANAGDQIASTLWHTLAGIGQFLVPLVFIIGAIASFGSGRHRARLLQKAGGHRSSAGLSEMSWQDFEKLAHELLRLQGYSIEPLGGSRADGGVDLIARRPGEVTLIQCKHWRTKQVGVKVVRELLGVVTANGATAGVVVTSGVFTDDAMKFAQGQRIRLIDGATLRATAQSLSTNSQHAMETTRPPSVDSKDRPTLCPLCRRTMALRVARRGARSGSSFWGCSSFPSCRGTREIQQRVSAR